MISRLTLGDHSPERIQVVIEIPKGSRNKYEYNYQTGLIHLDRVLHSPLFYPADYGFVPQTLSPDGDSLDVLVLINQPTFPGCVIEVRPIGILDMEDEAGHDAKLIAVALHDPYYNQVQDITDINSHLKREIQHFFASYKQLESNKSCTVREWQNKQAAHDAIIAAHEVYTSSTR